MDWKRLLDEELDEYLENSGINPKSMSRAEKLNIASKICINPQNITQAVRDLQIATNYAKKYESKYGVKIRNSGKRYDIDNIRRLNSQGITKFAKTFGLPKSTHEQIIRILRYLEILDEPNRFEMLPPDILSVISLNTEAKSLLNLCETQPKLSQICSDKNIWLNKAEHDFGYSPEKYNKLYYEQGLRDPIFTYLLARKEVSPSYERELILTKKQFDEMFISHFGSTSIYNQMSYKDKIKTLMLHMGRGNVEYDIIKNYIIIYY